MGDVDQFDINQIFEELDLEASKLIEQYKQEIAKSRIGALDMERIKEIKVDSYGTKVPLYQVATLMKQSATSIVITPWDKNAVKSIVDALIDQLSEITPSVKGTSIYINMPPITAERKKELLRLISQIAERFRQKLRDVRNDAKKKLEALKKASKVSDEEFYKLIDRLDKVTRGYREIIDEIYKSKEKQLLE